jgi:hypothetical protein
MARFRLNLRQAQLNAVQTIAISREILEEFQGETSKEQFHCIVMNHNVGSVGISRDTCPDPFCKVWRRLPDKLTRMFLHLRTLTVIGEPSMRDSEERARLEKIVECVRLRESLKEILTSG